LDAVYKLGTALTLKDAITAPFDRITSNAEKLKSKFGELDGGMKKFENSMKSLKIGGGMMAAGAGMTYFTKTLLDANRETSKMQANLRSLDLGDSAIASITKSAVKSSETFGVARNEFLDAAYDIKSGIETINDAEIGKFTETVAQTAVATKGSTKQFASLFGTIYNQNKKFYEGMSDSNFGVLIGNSLSFAVKMYKTEGSKMQQAIESISGAAAAAGYDMAEQFNVLGSLQNVMQAGEAGTGFRAFIGKATEASQKLRLSFHNQQGQLLPVADILDRLRGKFGDVLTASEKLDLVKAFGSEEAMKLIDNLWDKSGKLRTNIDALRNAKGSEFLEKMAAANLANLDTQLVNLGNSWDNLKSTFGGGMGEGLMPFFDILKSGISLINEFAMSHPKLTKWVGVLFAVGSAVVFVGGGLMTLKAINGLYTLSQVAAGNATNVSALSLIRQRIALIASATATKLSAAAHWVHNAALSTTAWGSLAAGVAKYTIALGAHQVAVLASAGASKIAAAAQWLWNAAFIASPIGWIVVGVAALGAGAYMLIKHWTAVKTFFTGFWNWISNIFGNAWSKFKNFGAKLISTFFEGIKEKAPWLASAFDKLMGDGIGKKLPHSDAQEGPFSKLSYSGRALITTFNTGIEQEARRTPAVTPYMKNTMNTLSGQGNGPVAGGPQRGGLTISVANLIGTLTMGGQTKTGTIDDLARVMARAIHNELLRYGNG